MKTKNQPFVIREFYAFVAMNDDHNGEGEYEGVVGMAVQGQILPFVAADTVRVNQMLPQVQHIANVTGQRISLIKFATRTEMGVIEPQTKKQT